MYASALRSDPILPPAAACAGRQRAEGRVTVSVARFGSATGPVRIAESGSLRIRLPRRVGPRLEGVIINTGGGIVCGDRLSVEAVAGPETALVLTTPAAEKVYRSDGPVTEMSVRLSLGHGAELSWLPQETILFDRARLRRRIEADMPGGAKLLVFEAVVFGRAAHGEEVRSGLLEDRWRIHCDGRLIHADTLRLSGDISALLDRPGVAGGGRALASLVYVAPDAEARLDEARAILDDSLCLAGASAWNGLLAVRFVAAHAAELRRETGRFIEMFTGEALPRVWRS